MSKKTKRRLGDRADGHRVRDVTGLQTIMSHLMPNRTDCEVFLHDSFDVTDMLSHIKEKNEAHPEYKITLFHAFIYCFAKMIHERPNMNRFIQGRRLYQRDEISMSFVVKRRHADYAEESLMVLVPKDDQCIDDITRKIVGDVKETRKSETSTGGVDALMDKLAKLPRILLMLIVKIVRIMDFWGICPRSLMKGDPNFTTILFSNLGSIKGPAIYHHLNNYGTNSMVITIGTIYQKEALMPDGEMRLRDFVDIGITLDERIGDGFYFVRCLNIVRYLFTRPELLDEPLASPSGYEENSRATVKA